ncbi:phosphate ABC transporter substrate-binding protein PstS [Ideonella sp. DXS29W]|uniref:Phosphate-binding protein PstS n=1 Tax=Ideonella lacteola TaxID=2984193 RepID=A0ABU9BXS0_9BURK
MLDIVGFRAGLVGLGLAFALMAPRAETITGAGSFASGPIYKTWAGEFAKSNGHQLAYQAIGSNAAMAKLAKREVDFGSSDVMATADELKKNDWVMVPTALTGVVPVINLPSVASNALRLDGERLVRIYLGQITHWDAPEIRALNPDVKLPALPIKLVVRSDFAGANFYVSDYFSQISPEWKQRKGVAPRIDWGAGTLPVTSTSAVSETVRNTPGAIGWIDFNNAQDDGLAMATLRNADGQFVAAGAEGFREAAVRSGWFTAGDFSASLTNRAGARSWPVTMATYIAVPRVAQKKESTELALRFITWGYLHGDSLARQARFVPLPAKVQASAFREIARVTGPQGEALGVGVVAGAMK